MGMGFYIISYHLGRMKKEKKGEKEEGNMYCKKNNVKGKESQKTVREKK